MFFKALPIVMMIVFSGFVVFVPLLLVEKASIYFLFG